MSDINRKRKRSVSRNNGAVFALPNIPHVPRVLVPPFLETLRCTCKFFSKRVQSSFTIQDWECRGNDTSYTTIHDNIVPTHTSTGNVRHDLMRRMELVAAATAEQHDLAGLSETRERRDKMIKAVNQWIEEVKHFAARKPTLAQSLCQEHDDAIVGTNQPNPQIEIKERPSIPYALFLYLWGMQQEHDRIAVRRAALFLSSLLLQKSKDCRQHLELESNLANWISNIMGQNLVWKNVERAKNELPLLHQEAYATLTFLLDQGYGNLYPKIGVACQSLRHQCPHLEAKEISPNTGVSELRRLRDLAIRYGQEEIRRVAKLVNKADNCLEILVPRVGMEAQVAISKDPETKNMNFEEHDCSDDEGFDIDWEDGDDPDEMIAHRNTNIGSHISAVDHTIAAMQASGATLFCGGELEIDFDRPEEDIKDDEMALEPERCALARQKLEKYVEQLSRRHLGRLTVWLDGLQNADGLVRQSDKASLVSIPSEHAALRLVLIQQLSESKQEISRILSSASRLNVKAKTRNTEKTERGPRSIAVGLGGLKNERFHKMLRQSNGKAKNKSHSTRIQIKCNSR
jgi:hypothetical protein